jgi:hypothetical protein
MARVCHYAGTEWCAANGAGSRRRSRLIQTSKGSNTSAASIRSVPFITDRGFVTVDPEVDLGNTL